LRKSLSETLSLNIYGYRQYYSTSQTRAQIDSRGEALHCSQESRWYPF
jgi:hypothetical protein